MGSAQRKTGRRIRSDFPARAPAAPQSPPPPPLRRLRGASARPARPARFVAPSRMTWRARRQLRLGPSDLGAPRFLALRSRRPRPSPRRAFSIVPKPAASAGRRRELLRCIIPRCLFRPDFFLAFRAGGSKRADSSRAAFPLFAGADGAKQPALEPTAAQETKTGSNLGRHGKEKVKGKLKEETGRKNKGRSESATARNPGPTKRRRRTARQPQAKKQKTTNARKRTRAISRNKAAEGFSPLKCR